MSAGSSRPAVAGGSQGVGGRPTLRGPQPRAGLGRAAASLPSGLPLGAAPQPVLPSAAPGGVRGREPSPEETKAFFDLMKTAGATVEQVGAALEGCPRLVFVKNDACSMPLHVLFYHANQHPQLLDIVTLLVKKGAQLGARDKYTSTPLHMLFYHANQHPQLLEIATLLVKKGAPLDVVNNYGFTPLHMLFDRANQHPKLLDIVMLLVEMGAPLGARDISDSTPLHALFNNANQHSQLLKIATLLVENSAPLDVVNNCGSTPLHMLFYHANKHPKLLDIVTLLVEKGAPLDVVNNYDFTPLHMLFRHANQHSQLLEIATLLLRYGPYPGNELYQQIAEKIQTVLNSQVPGNPVLLNQYLYTQQQAQACQQALALCLYGYLQTVIGLDALKQHIDACPQENINNPMPGSMYPALWHAVAHFDAEAVEAAFQKGAGYRQCLPGTQFDPLQFIIKLREAFLEDKQTIAKLDQVSVAMTQRWQS